MPTGRIFFGELIASLTTYVKQAAWLNTVPEKQKRPRRETKHTGMPPVNAGGYLLEILFEIGPTKPAGMAGQVGIDEADLLAWQVNQQIGLRPWEAGAIRLLSREYAGMLADASDPSCPAPWAAKVAMTVEKRDAIADAMASWADNVNASMK